ncbi:MAG TPA: SUMF1/EgtB/PvdO family nonheme iron enzyme [Steroidobacteraceae bacterium]|nr:SUMF1/EgtB/PvdO family nonheme iron enzyme [Steroidobacteraceae bacterium]
MSSKTTSPASVFETVLRAFETGDLAYTEVLAQLKRVLATGVSPTELLEILRRRELIEPLPKYAHVQVLGLLTDAIEREAAQNADPDTAPDQIPNAVPAATRFTSMVPPKDLTESPSKATIVSLTSITAPISVPRPDRSAVVGESAVTSRARTAPSVGASGSQLGSTASVPSEFIRSSGADLPSSPARARSEERSARQNADYEALTRSYERTKNAESAAVARAAALAAELAAARTALESEQSRAQNLVAAVAESIASTEAVRLRSENARRESERYQTESHALRESLAARDAIIAQVRSSLGEREAELAALQQEHAKIVPAVEARAKIGTQLESDLQVAQARATALTAELAAARAALESEQGRAQKLDKALAESIASTKEARSRSEEALRESERYQTESRALRDSLAARDTLIVQVRRALGEREAELAALQQEYAKIVPALDARSKTGARLEADLQAARAHADAIKLELKASQDAAAVLDAKLKRSESRLNATLTELGALQTQSSSYLELLRSREWRRGLDQNKFRELDARVNAADLGRGALQTERDHLQAQLARLQAELETREASIDETRAMSIERVRTAASADAERTVEMQNAAQPLAALPRATQAPATQPRESELSNARSPGAIGRAMGLSAAVFVLAVVVAWFSFHRAPLPTQVPGSSSTAPHPGTMIHDCPTCPAMTVLPTGRFKQGSARAESASFEKPLHWVAIVRPFAMSVNAVTVDEFGEFVAATGRDMQGCDTYDGEWKLGPKNSWKDPGFVQTGTHPVTCVSWNDAMAYAGWLSTKTGHPYRLPSASEWEYAARAGAEAVQPWNPDGSGACANANVADGSAAHRYPGWLVFACDDGYVYTAPVGSFRTNSLGLNDMLGNVFQWTEDCWHADYAGAPIDASARTDGNCSEHELRGGSWFTTPAYVRANYRNRFAADYRTSTVGIRLVRDIEQ